MADITLHQLIDDATKRLAETSDSARLDAEILLGHALGRPRTWVLAHDNDRAPPAARDKFRVLVDRRVLGEPVAYLTGKREFWSLDLGVRPGVLIPRPDTETLVQAALELGGEDCRVVDLGTGSGAIALALASERPRWRIVATDSEPAALEVARANAEGLGLADRITFVAADGRGSQIRSYGIEENRGSDPMVANRSWYQVLDGMRFDLIVSNPPYVAEFDPHLDQGDVRFEPRTALVSGLDGLNDIGAIIAGAREHLNDNGWLLLEHGHDQSAKVADLMHAVGFDTIRHWMDLGGHVRVTGGRR